MKPVDPIARLRALEGRGKFSERVLADGTHHVWYSIMGLGRFDSEHRDFAFACRMLWARVCVAFPWLAKEAG